MKDFKKILLAGCVTFSLWWASKYNKIHSFKLRAQKDFKADIQKSIRR